MLIKKQRAWLLVVAMLFFMVGPALADESQSAAAPEVEKKIHATITLNAVIKARPEFVWAGIHDARTKYPGLAGATMLSEDEKGSVFEQKFAVPIVGDTACTFSLTDSPPNRVDYKLLKSGVFSALDGSWILTPGMDGQSTSVELTCFVAAKGVVPKFLVKLLLSKKLAKQLDFVKTTAEKKEIEKQATEKQNN